MLTKEWFTHGSVPARNLQQHTTTGENRLEKAYWKVLAVNTHTQDGSWKGDKNFLLLFSWWRTLLSSRIDHHTPQWPENQFAEILPASSCYGTLPQTEIGRTDQCPPYFYNSISSIFFLPLFQIFQNANPRQKKRDCLTAPLFAFIINDSNSLVHARQRGGGKKRGDALTEC